MNAMQMPSVVEFYPPTTPVLFNVPHSMLLFSLGPLTTNFYSPIYFKMHLMYLSPRNLFIKKLCKLWIYRFTQLEVYEASVLFGQQTGSRLQMFFYAQICAKMIAWLVEIKTRTICNKLHI